MRRYPVVAVGNNGVEWRRVFLRLSIGAMEWNPLRVGLTFGKNVVWSGPVFLQATYCMLFVTKTFKCQGTGTEEKIEEVMKVKEGRYKISGREIGRKEQDLRPNKQSPFQVSLQLYKCLFL